MDNIIYGTDFKAKAEKEREEDSYLVRNPDGSVSLVEIRSTPTGQELNELTRRPAPTPYRAPDRDGA